ncbi:hypothetical protein K440DRAFT_633716 [Wilcoxina mikolae CBS 423.85]|nr:hypothetical protein K440DRAFT_633716 [Wilcoxina mikolae CBS 423.85]
MSTQLFLLLLPSLVHSVPLHPRDDNTNSDSPAINSSGVAGLCIIFFFVTLVVGMLFLAQKSRKDRAFGPAVVVQPTAALWSTRTITTTIQPPQNVYSRENPRGARAVYRVPTVEEELAPPPPTYQEARAGAGKDGGRVGTMEVARMDRSRPSYLEAVGGRGG